MKPWEPQQKESSKAFAAFAEYRDLGPDRSIEIVRQKFKTSYTNIARWSAKFAWVERAKEYDAYLDLIRASAREQSIAKQARRIMTADEVREGLTRIAEADIADVFESDGSFDLVAARERGATKLIKSLSFDKDSGRVTKVETYSAHEGHRDMGKTHAIFTDKVEHNHLFEGLVERLRADLPDISEEELRAYLGEKAQELGAIG